MRTYLTFGDIEGKLDFLIVECTRCPRKGRYSIAKLIARHGRDGMSLRSLNFPSMKANRQSARLSELQRGSSFGRVDWPPMTRASARLGQCALRVH
jgi:hypothetical protein